MESFTIQDAVESGVTKISLSGQLVVFNSKKILKQIKSVKSDTTKVSIKLEEVEDLDLSVIQILKAFALDKAKQGVQVQYELDLNSELQILLTQTGLLSSLNQ